MNRFDIYWADVPFEDSDKSKLRPVLILNDVALMISAYKITSQGKSADYQVKIKNWKGAGLTRESYICIDKCVKLEKSCIGEKLGELQIEDKLALQRAMIR